MGNISTGDVRKLGASVKELPYEAVGILVVAPLQRGCRDNERGWCPCASTRRFPFAVDDAFSRGRGAGPTRHTCARR